MSFALRVSFQSRAIASLIVVAIIVAILLAAIGGVVYLTLERGGSNSSLSSSTSSANTQQASTTSSSSGSSSTPVSSSTTPTSVIVSTTTSSSSASSSLSSGTGATTSNGYVLLLQSFSDLFGNFSQMSVVINSSAGPLLANYSVVGHFAINSTQLAEVNFTMSGNGEVNSQILWFNPEGNITMITYAGANYTAGDSSAGVNITQIVGGYFVDEFAFVSGSASILSGLGLQGGGLSQFSNLGTSAQSLGPTQLSVTSYSRTVGGIIYNIRVGTVSGTNIQLVTYSAFTSGNETDSYQVTSLTKA